MSAWRILVVEDDPYGQQVAATILEHEDIVVDLAKDAEEGLALLTANDYTAAIIDLALPGMDGWGLLKTIQGDARTAGLPCIAVTAYHSPQVAQEAIRAGFVGYLPKPLQVRTFVARLQGFLA